MRSKLDSASTTRLTRRRGKLVLLGFVALFAVGGSVAGVRALLQPEDSGQRARAPRPVRVAVVGEDATPYAFSASGVTRAERQARLAFTVGGRVEVRQVELGDMVAEGAILAQLESHSYQNQVRAARADLQRARAQLSQAARHRRVARQLVEAEAGSRISFDDASSSVNLLHAGSSSAGAQLDEAERLLAESILDAPFAGRITDVLVQPGEVVAPGQPAFVLSGGDAIELEVEVPESDVGHVHVGDRVTVDLPLAGVHGVRAEVLRVGGAASLERSTFPIVLRLEPRDGIMPGMAAEVRFESATELRISVPVRAVVNPGGQHPLVFRVTEGKVQKVEVDVIRLARDRVAITGALSVGDWVVVGGHGSLVDGQPVLVVDAEATPER